MIETLNTEHNPLTMHMHNNSHILTPTE